MEKGGGRFMQGQKVKFIDKQFLAAMPILGDFVPQILEGIQISRWLDFLFTL